MKRRSFIQSTAGIAALAACAENAEKKPAVPVSDHGFNLYWGDLHTHCNITYGHGSMEDALEAAVEQLDFCAVVAHALWPDIPRDNKVIAPVVDYHLEAFARVRKNWKQVEDLNLKYRKPGKFIPFLAYECHNMKDGDHNVYHIEPRAQIKEAESIPDLKARLKGEKALVIPHHMGYIKGNRGFNWDSFVEGDQTPFIEIYSRHGNAESDTGPYPNLHDMGPRSHEGTAQCGLERGHKFGMIGSTDQHGGYPGSYGDGRIAVFAKELTAQSLWEAFLARRVYGTTGEKIALDFRVDNHLMGEALAGGGKRNLYLKVEGNDFLDYLELIKNGKRILRLDAPYAPAIPRGDRIRAKVRFEWGWGRKTEYTHWEGAVELTGGRVLSVTPCFRGLQATSPLKGIQGKTMVSRLPERSETGCVIDSYTIGNPNTVTPTTCSVVLDVEMGKKDIIRATVNGKKFEHRLEELLEGTRSHFMEGWLSEAVSFHRAVPETGYLLEKELTDDSPERTTDYYYLRVRQKNNQWAWSSPIWVRQA
jgi:hypothetical protein